MKNYFRIMGRICYDKTCTFCDGAGFVSHDTDHETVVESFEDASREELADLALEAFMRNTSVADAEWALPLDEIIIEPYTPSPAEVMARTGAPTLFDLLDLIAK